MQAMMETIFDSIYLVFVITIGIRMMKNAMGNKERKLLGIMAVVLGGGDAFHLLPRMAALWVMNTDSLIAVLGIGKLITSITMTIFYLLLFQIYLLRYAVNDSKILSLSLYSLAAVRIFLCLLPQNDWLSADAPVTWGIYRNIPFVIMGIIIIVLFYRKAKEKMDHQFKYMWLAIVLSFGLYIPVVLWVDQVPMLGMLMIPKTCAYVWIVLMGYRGYNKNN
ncbi:MAG: hypothetical protein K0S01_2931 [Herbinix sp.]|jgi:hypothetical protein|nr:hypothetical protein [Herbinix sp.]